MGRRLCFVLAGCAAPFVGSASGCGGSDNSDLVGDSSAGKSGSGGTRADGSVARCTNSLDCPQGLVCDSTTGACVDCNSDADCTNGQRCHANQCSTPCVSDKECTPLGKLCNQAIGFCESPGSGGAGGSGGSTGGSGGSTGGSAGSIGGSGGSIGGSGGSTGGSGGSIDGSAGSGGCGLLDVVLLFDSSGSMANPPPTGTSTTKWTAAVDSFNQWAQATPAVRVALQFHPVAGPPPPATCVTNADCGAGGLCYFGSCLIASSDSCDPTAYEAPAVPLSLLPNNAAAFASALAAATPTGGSPYIPALEGAVAQAHGIALANPTDTTIVVFVADGESNACLTDGGTGWPETTAVAASGLSGTPSIRTYMVPINTALAAYDALAQAGGTGQAIYASDGNLAPALQQIVAQYPCP